MGKARLPRAMLPLAPGAARTEDAPLFQRWMVGGCGMRLVSFNLFRSLGIPGVAFIKPSEMYARRTLIEQADWVLFPETWQLNTLLYAFGKRIFPSPASYHLGADKVQMTRAFWAICPEHVPYTRIEANDAAGSEAVLDTFAFPFVAKEIRHAMGQGVHLIADTADWRRYAGANAILYTQELLPINRDLRIAVIGRHAVAAYWRERPSWGFHTNVARGGRIVHDGVPASAVALAERVAGVLGIDHAGFDIAWVDGHPYLFEFNVLFGNQGLGECGVRPADEIYRYLEAMTPRDKPTRPPGRRLRQAA
jgi:ribosomal protein S6--L-glutamate ligase